MRAAMHSRLSQRARPGIRRQRPHLGLTTCRAFLLLQVRWKHCALARRAEDRLIAPRQSSSCLAFVTSTTYSRLHRKQTVARGKQGHQPRQARNHGRIGGPHLRILWREVCTRSARSFARFPGSPPVTVHEFFAQRASRGVRVVLHRVRCRHIPRFTIAMGLFRRLLSDAFLLICTHKMQMRLEFLS